LFDGLPNSRYTVPAPHGENPGTPSYRSP
jgi:hypothetical protein